MSGKLQRIAQDWWVKTLDGDRPSGPEVQERYGLTVAQFNVVKQRMRKIAKSANLVWGWNPDIEKYMVSGGDHAKTILNYQLRHWQEEGRAADDTFSAAKNANLVSQRLAQGVHSLATEFDARIETLAQEFEQEDS